MNELMIHVERIVRPVRAMQARKLKMRRELLAHLEWAVNEERAHVASETEAIKRAKEETVRYVVWLQIGSELADSGRKPSSNSVDELYVSYTIFEPGTAKFKQSGRSHHQIYQTGRGGVSTPNKNSPLYSEYALKQAARETAQRILDAFEIRLSDDRILH